MSSKNSNDMTVDVQVSQQLKEVVDEITNSGQKELNPALSKKFKTICKKSDVYVEEAFHLIMAQLEKDHAEIRLSSLLLVDMLFSRSNCFRELLLADFQDFMPLCLDIDHELPLPPPKPAAQLLQTKAVEFLQKWQDNYGQAYKKLSLGYNYLRTCKKINFANYQAQSLAEQQREAEKRRKIEAVKEKQLEASLLKFQDLQEDAKSCLVQIKSCFSLLIPDPETFEMPDLSSPEVSSKGKGGVRKRSFKRSISVEEEDDSAPSDEDDDELAVHGMLSQKYALSITVPDGVTIEENDDNTDVLATLKDSLRLIESKQLPSLTKALEVFTRCGADQKSIKEALDLKESLQSVRHKVTSIQVKPMLQERNTETEDDDESDYDDFEEVPSKEGYEADIPEFLKETKKKKASQTNRNWCLPKMALDEASQESDPTTWLPTIQKMKQTLKKEPPVRTASPQPSTSAAPDPEREKQLQKAPVLPYSTDLHFWGREDADMPMVTRVTFDTNNFWSPIENDDKVDEKALAEMKSRVISYPGQFEEVKWKCRAPMANGKLCERMDRKKCPFHGMIVPRNVIGQPTREEDIVRLAKEEHQAAKKKAEWDDPELQREIEAAKGVKVQRSKRSKRAKNPNLTDISKISDTNRNRLKSKVFNKGALKRVASAMDSLDHRRHKDKFANQFNYAYSTS